MRVSAGGKFVTRNNGTVWPTPMDHVDGGLEWRLRYAADERMVKDRYTAASIVSAYRQLIALPQKERNAVIRDIRAAIKQTLASEGNDL